MPPYRSYRRATRSKRRGSYNIGYKYKKQGWAAKKKRYAPKKKVYKRKRVSKILNSGFKKIQKSGANTVVGFSRTYKKPHLTNKIWKDLSEPQYYMKAFKGIIMSNNVGYQGFNSVMIGSTNDLKNVATAALLTGANSWIERAFIESVGGTITVSNFSTNPCRLWCYVCRCRRDSIQANGAITDWATGVALMDAVDGHSQENPMSTPFDSPGFTRGWKVLKIDERFMTGGEQLTINYNLMFNKWISNSDIYEANNVLVASRFWSHQFLFRMIPNIAAENGAPGGATIPVGKVCLTYTEKWKLRRVATPNPYIYRIAEGGADTLPVALANAVQVDQMEDDVQLIDDI
nr:MAG: capsid protein [Cressdnaviricota sp.]